MATDCNVNFKEADVRVQVKCTSGLTIGGKTKSYSLKKEWLRKWDDVLVPVYFVIVVVPKTEQSWLQHKTDGTFHKTAAFWAPAPRGAAARSITIPKTQRLTIDTVPVWHADLIAMLTTGAA